MSNVWSAKAVLGLLFSALCVALGVWAVDWKEALTTVSRVRIWWLLSGILALCGSFACFAMRWRALLGDVPLLRAHHVLGYLMVGYMTNAVLPLRPGDLLRAALIRGRHHATMAAALSSIVLERLMDILSVVLLGFLVAMTIELPPAVEVGLYTFAGAGILGAGVIAALSVRAGMLAAAAARLSRIGSIKATFHFLRPFADGLAILRRRRHFWAALLWNALAWGGFVLFMASMLVALGVPAPPAAAILVVVAVSLGAAIPSSPGAIGVYHAVAVLALSVWEVPTAPALAFALATHGVAISLHIGLGAASASAMGVRNVLRQARSQGEPRLSKP